MSDAEAPFPGDLTADLTDDQREAADAFAAWLKSSSPGVPFVLSGFAGSGKAFLSMRLLRMVEATGLCWTVVAPTHKAVGVLRQALNLEGLQPTWYPSTIHRLLRLKLKRQGDRELCEPTEQTAMALEHLGLVLIDEASMVDSSLLQVALQCAHPFRTRLVFVGDPAQLPPVGEADSPVFAMERANAACLQQVVRIRGLCCSWRVVCGTAAWLTSAVAAALLHASGKCGQSRSLRLACACSGGAQTGIGLRQPRCSSHSLLDQSQPGAVGTPCPQGDSW